MTDVIWSGVVKVQRSLYSNTAPAGSEVCIYSEDRSVFWIGPIDAALERWFPKRGSEVRRSKFFAHAELVGTIINIKRKVKWQEW